MVGVDEVEIAAVTSAKRHVVEPEIFRLCRAAGAVALGEKMAARS